MLPSAKKMQSTFEIFSTTKFKNLPEQLAEDMILELKNERWHKDFELYKSICIAHPDFRNYITAIDRIQDGYIKLEKGETIHQFSLEDYLEIPSYEPKITPLHELLETMQFAEVKFINVVEKAKVVINKIYQARDLFKYWLPKNTFHYPNDMQHIGLGQAIFNAIPEQHNYLDMCWICSCGDTCCYNYIAWYIKNINSYTVGFIINRHTKLEFNTQHQDYEDEKYEEYFLERAELIKHNNRLAEIEDAISKNDDFFSNLNDDDKAILKKGELTDNYPYVFEQKNFCIFNPLLNKNSDFLFLQ